MMKLDVTHTGNGRPLLLIHGFGTSSSIWEPILPELAASFRVTTLDLPGFGKSAFQAELSSIDALATSLARHLSEPGVVLGWSLGGMIATKIALLFPEKLTHLVNVASTPKFNADRISWHAGIDHDEMARFRQQMIANPKQTLKDFIELQLRGAKLTALQKNRLEQSLAAMPPHPQAIAYALDLLQYTDLRHELHRLKMPALYVFGDKDVFIPKDTLHEIKACHPGAHHVVMSRATHSPFLSRPQEFIPLLIEFVNTRYAPPR